MKKELEWMRRQPKARGTKSKSRVDAFYDIKDKASSGKTDAQMQLNVKVSRQGNKIIELEHISKSFGEKKIIKDFSYVFKKRDRIGIVGKNGTGKSTFLNMLTGKVQPDSGQIIKGETTVFGYYTQEITELKENARVIENVTEVAEFITMGNGQNLSASALLQHFLFTPARQYTPVYKLSGGEKKRLMLLRVLMKNPNFLILDEPTNDLDLTTLSVLEEFLENYGGCLLIVSHDRYFMDRLVEHLFVFEGDGTLRTFPGNYTDYRNEQEEMEADKSKPKAAPAAKPASDKQEKSTEDKSKKLNFNEKREYETLEKEIEELEKKKETLVQKLNSGNLPHEELTQLSLSIEDLIRTINSKSERWLELADRME
ncbi:MAG: ABC-F family ATP-binding cassette domain-containing protein [Cytophagaceae bacterium]